MMRSKGDHQDFFSGAGRHWPASLCFLLFMGAFSAVSLNAQTREPAPDRTGISPRRIQASGRPAGTNGSASAEKIETRADSMTWNRQKGVIEAKGNVIVIKGDQELRADYVIVNTVTEDADAFGNVTIKLGTEVWRGDRLNYNFGTGSGDAGNMSYEAKSLTLVAEKVNRKPGNIFHMDQARATTCVHGVDHGHYHVRLKEITLVPGESITGKHAVFCFGSVPVFYLPYWYRDLNAGTGWSFRPGYRSRWGAFLLSSYRSRISDVLKSETHFDYRTKRGFGMGQDFGWNTPHSNGEVEFYYVNDDEPLDENNSPDNDIDSSRYRIKVRNTSSLSDRGTLYLQGEYVSDDIFRQDFFESDFKQTVQPDNYAIYSHRGDRYTLDFLARSRFNDFYDGVNRLPEVSLNVLRQPLADTLLYYESKTALANLERVYKDGSSSDDYSVFRMDTGHYINYPGSYFGFLSFVPRTGLRGTYYSATRESSQEQQFVNVSVTNAVTGVVTSSVQTNSVNIISDGPADFRTGFELGFETSFKAFKTWGGAADPRRHVVEPYANYTFVPEPNVLPESLYQFDDVDTLNKTHTVRLGVRNKYQKKIDDVPFDLADINIYTILLMDREEGQDALSNYYFDGRLQPSVSSIITFDGHYDTAASELGHFNTRIEYSGSDLWSIAGSYHYAADNVSLMTADVTLLPNRSWTWNLFGRYNAEDSRFEEQGGYIQRNLDCMSIRTRMSVLPGYTRSDGSDIEDEWRVFIEFWLSAFPEMRISAKHGG